jgi:hypothetical protein
MIHYFDFEQGKAEDPGHVPTIFPIQDLKGQDRKRFRMVLVVLANGKTLQAITEWASITGIPLGSRVVVVFDEGMRASLMKQGWEDPGPGMPGILEGVFPLASGTEDDCPF